MGGSVHTIKKSTEALVVASKEIGLKANVDESKYMVMSRDQNAGQNHKKKRLIIHIWNGGTVEIFGNSPNESKFHTGRNQERIKVRESFLSFTAESFVFQFTTLECKV